MNKYARWAIRLIGPALLIIFLWRSDFSLLLAGLSQVKILPLLLSLALFLPFIAIEAWRWNMLMRELDMPPPPLGFSMVLYQIGLFLGGTTPGQSGDFIKAWYLRERGLPLAPALFSIVLDRLFDFLVMALLALLALVAFIDILPGTLRIATVAFAALSLRPAPLARLLLASAGSATSTIVRIYLLFLALQLDRVPATAIISSTALISILQALPISFSGIGVRDAVLIAVLGYYGYPKELALILSALFLVLNIEHMLIGFIYSLRYPLGSAPPADLQGEQANG